MRLRRLFFFQHAGNPKNKCKCSRVVIYVKGDDRVDNKRNPAKLAGLSSNELSNSRGEVRYSPKRASLNRGHPFHQKAFYGPLVS